MITELVDRFMERKAAIREAFKANPPSSYSDIVKTIVEFIRPANNSYGYKFPDPKRITCIDHCHHQGTLLFVIAAGGYQPYNYWCTKVDYGSCSGCDTLQGIEKCYEWGEDGKNHPTEQCLDDLMALALHIIQQMKKI